jgi:hypothetical protein
MKINGESPVTSANFGEWLVLYTDNELNADQRKSVEQFIEKNPALQKEVTLLQQCKLQPEQIVFAGKEYLYRKEKKVRSLPVSWKRFAAAAVLILGIGITTVVVLNNRTSDEVPVVKNSGTESKTNTVGPDKILPGKENIQVNKTAVADNLQQVIFTPVEKQNNKNTFIKSTNPDTKMKIPANVPSAIKKEEPVLVDQNKPSNNLPLPINNPILNKNNLPNESYANNDPGKEINNKKESLTIPPVTNTKVKSSPIVNPEVKFASLEEGGKNKKNRGLLRKLARTVEKRTNMNATDDDRLLVGGFAFKVK